VRKFVPSYLLLNSGNAMTATNPLPQLMQMGCTNVTLTYRAAGYETVCLQSASHGVQQLVGFNAAKGDVIGVDDILETTLAHDDLSDVANYITSVVSGGNTTLYFDPTGKGLQGSAFAVLQGVSTTVAQLVADGGMQYVPDAITLTPTFDTPFTLRSGGLETVNLLAPAPGIGPEQINGFNPTNSDVLQLRAILNPTTALANLSNVQKYITATTVGGNTILSVDTTGTGKPGTAFVELDGVTTTVSQLLADNALIYTPSFTTVDAKAGATFVFRDAGDEMAVVEPAFHGATAPQLQGFSLAAGDSLSVHNILLAANLSVPTASLGNYFSTTQSNGSTSLWFNSAGSGHGGQAVATLQNSLVSIGQLLSADALNVGAAITPTTPNPAGPVVPIMHMGCTNVLITYRQQGQETVCLQSPSHGVQRLANFNAELGDVIGVDDILELTTAKTDLSDVAKYITSTVSAAGTALYFDPTGKGLQGSQIAILQGVDTTVAELVANGGMQYIPDAISVTMAFNTPLAMRPSGLETVKLLAVEPGVAAQQINGFNPDLADVLELQAILNPTTASPDLSNVQNYIKATTVGGNTILSVDPTGTGQAGTAFAQLNGVSVTLSQLLADDALTFTPSKIELTAGAGKVFQFRPEGDEIASLPTSPAHNGFATLQAFSLGNGDVLDIGNMLAASKVSPDMANLGNFISAQQSGGSTSLWFDATGSGHGGGAEFALLQNTTTTVASLTAHNAWRLT
jgi:hypothetical protein